MEGVDAVSTRVKRWAHSDQLAQGASSWTASRGIGGACIAAESSNTLKRRGQALLDLPNMWVRRVPRPRPKMCLHDFPPRIADVVGTLSPHTRIGSYHGHSDQCSR